MERIGNPDLLGLVIFIAFFIITMAYNKLNCAPIIHSDSPDDQRAKRVARGLSLLLSAHTQIPYKGPYHHGYGDNPFDSIVARTKDTTRSKWQIPTFTVL